jgi:hypothetical protein
MYQIDWGEALTPDYLELTYGQGHQRGVIGDPNWRTDSDGVYGAVTLGWSFAGPPPAVDMGGVVRAIGNLGKELSPEPSPAAPPEILSPVPVEPHVCVVEEPTPIEPTTEGHLGTGGEYTLEGLALLLAGALVKKTFFGKGG